MPECSEGEDYKTCGPAQEGTCVAPMPVVQPGTCTPGCSCMEGFVRHEGKCINVTECPSTCIQRVAIVQIVYTLCLACISNSIASLIVLILFFFTVTARFPCDSYSVKEGDGICLPIMASGNLNRDFEVTVNLGRQLAAG